jgi:S1-C subfamily serine protease
MHYLTSFARLCVALLPGLYLVAQGSPLHASEGPAIELMMRAVVKVEVVGPADVTQPGGEREFKPHQVEVGTGFFVDHEGFVVTAYHVLHPRGVLWTSAGPRITVRYRTKSGIADPVDAQEIVRREPEDLVLLRTAVRDPSFLLPSSERTADPSTLLQVLGVPREPGTIVPKVVSARVESIERCNGQPGIALGVAGTEEGWSGGPVVDQKRRLRAVFTGVYGETALEACASPIDLDSPVLKPVRERIIQELDRERFWFLGHSKVLRYLGAGSLLAAAFVPAYDNNQQTATLTKDSKALVPPPASATREEQLSYNRQVQALEGRRKRLATGRTTALAIGGVGTIGVGFLSWKMCLWNCSAERPYATAEVPSDGASGSLSMRLVPRVGPGSVMLRMALEMPQ